MVQLKYGSLVNPGMLINDVWNAEIWFAKASMQKISKQQICDCCGPCGNLYFLMQVVYEYLGHMPPDWIFWFEWQNKKN